MKCQSCGKKEATVRYFENVNGNKIKLHICSDCAKKLGFGGFSNLFSPLFTSIEGFDETFRHDVCENCGYSFDEYLSTGYFGCPKCYETFEDKLDDLFIKLHGKNKHIAIQSSSHKNKENDNQSTLEVNKLKEKLSELVKQERYEEAAIVRDEIKKLEGK